MDFKLAYSLIKEEYPEAYPIREKDIVITCIRQGCQKEGHLHITPSRNVVHCFKCGYATNLINFFKDANIKIDRLDVKILDPEDAEIEVRKKLELYPAELPKAYRQLPDDSRMGVTAMKYLIDKRGLSAEQVIKYKLGYCGSGPFFGRAIIPMYEKGILVYYEGRAFLPGIRKKSKYPTFLDSEIKDTQDIEYIKNGKSQIVFNIDKARGYDKVIITEGFFDAVAVGDDAVAILGHEISDIQFYKLLKCRFKEIITILDGDSHKMTLELANRFSSFVKTKIVLLQKGDPDDNKTIIRNLIDKAIDFDETYYYEQMLDPSHLVRKGGVYYGE